MIAVRILLEQESEIPDKWDSDIQDKSRLNTISQLSAQGAIQEAEELIDRLNSSNNKEIAREILSECKKGKVELGEIAGKFNIDPNYRSTKQERPLSPQENLFNSIWELIEKNKHSMTSSKQNYIKRQIGKISDMKLQIRLETRLGHFSLPSKYGKRHPGGLYKNTSLYETRNVKHIK